MRERKRSCYSCLAPKVREPVWWEVVDVLFDGGETAAAMRAQRYAVPVMTDLDFGGAPALDTWTHRQRHPWRDG